jgi:hypothetical protein
MKTLGIDLASKPANTATCTIDWSGPKGAEVIHWTSAATDDQLIELIEDPLIKKVGIDAPFGWPAGFVEALTRYRDNGEWSVDEALDLRYRTTEKNLKRHCLSPSLDLLAWVTVRCAGLLDALARKQEAAIDRTGEGLTVEVYPAETLRRWDLGSGKGYKQETSSGKKERTRLLKSLVASLDGALVVPTEFQRACKDRGGDHLLDALISALLARAMAMGRCDPIPPEAVTEASLEGWIRLPSLSEVAESVR